MSTRRGIGGGAVATSRWEGRALGVRFLNTGEPCVHGHLADRWVRSGCCVDCVLADRRRRIGRHEGGTEGYRLAQRIRETRRRQCLRKAGISVDAKREAERRSRGCLRVDRRPPWLLEELWLIDEMYRSATTDQRPDHIFPFMPKAGPICGVHALANIQLLTDEENNKKLNRVPAGEPDDFVARGMAVWIEHVGADGRVMWQNYVGDLLAEFYAAAHREFKEPFTARMLFAAQLPFAAEARSVRLLSDWLVRIVGLRSGGYRLDRVGRTGQGHVLFRVVRAR